MMNVVTSLTALARGLWPFVAIGYAVHGLTDPHLGETERAFLQGLYSVALLTIDPNTLAAPRPQA
jgi:hypothetical protein